MNHHESRKEKMMKALALIILMALLVCIEPYEPSSPNHDFFSLLDRIWIKFTHPRNGDVYKSGEIIPILIEVGMESKKLRVINGTHLTVPVSVDRIEYTLDVPVLSDGANAETQGLQNLVGRFCNHTNLHPSNCEAVREKLGDAISQYNSMLNGSREEPFVCMCLDDGRKECGELSLFASASSELKNLEIGKHKLELFVEGGQGDMLVPYGVSRFEIQPDCEWELSIKKPLHGSRIPSDLVDVIFELGPTAVGDSLAFDEISKLSRVCFGTNDWVFGCSFLDSPSITEVPAQSENTNTRMYKAQLEKLAVGRTDLEIWLELYESSLKVCNGTSSFEVISRGSWLERPTDDLVIVTAISESYFADGRIQNLIGSIHYWEPGIKIVFYELSLSEDTLYEVSRWENVEVRSLPPDVLPVHLYTAATYAFKPFVVNNALHFYRHVVWIDANVELRRTLDELRDILYMQGYFFMTHPAPFPTPQFHHPATNKRLGCLVPDHTRQHCATTIMAFQNQSWAHKELLIPMLECALDNTCINPPGSSRANHRQEQSVLNAIMCRLDVEVCSVDDKWRMQSFHRENYTLNLTDDETDWNEVVLYTRRSHPIKPYQRFLNVKSLLTPP